MENIEIKNRFSGGIIACGKYETIKDAVEGNKADLRRADLYGADLSGADLSGADLRDLLCISGSADYVQYYDGSIKIGCFFYSVEYWKMMYDTIGRENDYTESQIKEYRTYIKMCEQFQKEIYYRTLEGK